MSDPGSVPAWPPLVRALHWLMAAAIAGNLALGRVMSRAAEAARDTGAFDARVFGMGLFESYQLHKSVGVLLLALVALRLGVRLATRAPDARHASPTVQRAAKMVQALLYTLMITLPTTGWLLASSAVIGLTTVVFGIFPLPDLVARDPILAAWFGWLHEMLAWALAGLALLHAAAALKHHVIDRDETLRAMIRSKRPRRRQ